MQSPRLFAKLRPVSTTPRIALVAGASGLVGGFLVQALLEAPDYSRIFALTRRPLGREHAKLANRIVVFERMATQLKGLVANDAFCCIGTTIAEAGSQEAFREADLDAVLLFAEAARAAGATRFAVVSSVGASSSSKKFYLRTKGEMEDAVTAMGFAAVDIFQPSLLLGPRKQMRPHGADRRPAFATHQSVADRFARGLARHSGGNGRAGNGGCGPSRRAWHLSLHPCGDSPDVGAQTHPAGRDAILQKDACLKPVQRQP